MRAVRVVTVAVVVLAGSASSAVAQSPWAERAAGAAVAFEAADSGDEGAHAYAYMAGTFAALHGWDDPRVGMYLRRVYATQNPDGGFGLGKVYDAFQDGTVNPADTTYTVTITDHVGRVLLDGWQAGVVPQHRVERLVDLVLDTPRTPSGPGVCVAYSRSAADTRYCVPNVNAGAGWFLSEAARLGIDRPGMGALLAGITRRDAVSFDDVTGWWPYIEGRPALNDLNHNAYNAESERSLSPAIGAHATTVVLDRDEYDTWVDPLAQVRLLPFACDRQGDYLDEFDRMMADARLSARLLAQMGYWSARAARSC